MTGQRAAPAEALSFHPSVDRAGGEGVLAPAPTDPQELAGEVFAFCCRHMNTLVGRRDPAFEDLIQTAAEQALRALPTFEGRSSLSTWVFRVCYSAVLTERRWHRRWLKRFSLSDRGELPEAPNRSDATLSLEELEREHRVRAAIGRLAPKLQVVVTLHDLQGIGSEQIAELLDTNVLTIRSRLRDGRKLLAKRLAKDPYFGDLACARREP